MEDIAGITSVEEVTKQNRAEGVLKEWHMCDLDS